MGGGGDGGRMGVRLYVSAVVSKKHNCYISPKTHIKLYVNANLLDYTLTIDAIDVL